MRAKNRLSPYPILAEYSDDFKQGRLTVDISVSNSFGNLNLVMDYHLDSPYLQSLIDAHKAVFLTHIECPRTSFRTCLSGEERVQTGSIPLDGLADTVEVNTFITAVEDIDYSSEVFNSDYDGFRFTVRKNEILAIGDAKKISIENNTRQLESFPSVVRIVKIDDAQKAMSVDTDGDVIKIKLSGKIYDNYKTVGSSVCVKTSFSIVVFPAMIVVLTRMVQAAGTGELDDRRWFQVVSRQLEAKKVPLDRLSLDDGSILDACQKLFDDPIAKAFDELVLSSGGVNED